jgi:CxxC motif-containing protein
MITTTVKIEGSKLKRLPVVSRVAIKKEMIFDMINELEKIVVNAPVSVNDVIVSNILDSGIDIIASRSIKKDA